MSTVSSGLRTFDGRVVENSDLAEIISSSNESSIFASSNSVNVRTVLTCGEDTVGVPRNDDILGFPVDTSGVGLATLILFAVRHRPEQELVVTRIRSDVGAVATPVESCDERVMTLAYAYSPVVSGHVVNVNHAVVRANS
jgi:hypothetical protein